MATTDLKLDEPGSLPKPGPVGRVVRFLFGVLCLWYVSELIAAADSLIASDNHVLPLVWNGILPGLFLISYVVNIGFSRSWGKMPAIASAGLLAVAALASYLSLGTVETVLFARAAWIWEVYLFAHLGLSFVLAAVIGTPGCEMRALHDLYSRITGVSTKEHYCPIGPLHLIDQWEDRRSGSGRSRKFAISPSKTFRRPIESATPIGLC